MLSLFFLVFKWISSATLSFLLLYDGLEVWLKIFQVFQTSQVWVLEETMQLLHKEWKPLLAWWTWWNWTLKDVPEFMVVLLVSKVWCVKVICKTVGVIADLNIFVKITSTFCREPICGNRFENICIFIVHKPFVSLLFFFQGGV